MQGSWLLFPTLPPIRLAIIASCENNKECPLNTADTARKNPFEFLFRKDFLLAETVRPCKILAYAKFLLHHIFRPRCRMFYPSGNSRIIPRFLSAARNFIRQRHAMFAIRINVHFKLHFSIGIRLCQRLLQPETGRRGKAGKRGGERSCI